MENKNSFIQKLKSTFDLTPLELTLKTSFNKPILNFGDLIADYIDKKGENYKTQDLLKILNPINANNAYNGRSHGFLNDEQYIKNAQEMARNIQKLVQKPQYLEKLKDLVEANNKQGVGEVVYRSKTNDSKHKFSSIEYIAEEIEWLNPKEALRRRNIM